MFGRTSKDKVVSFCQRVCPVCIDIFLSILYYLMFPHLKHAKLYSMGVNCHIYTMVKHEIEIQTNASCIRILLLWRYTG